MGTSKSTFERDCGSGVRTRLVAGEREPRDEQVAVDERPERRQPERGAGVRARRERQPGARRDRPGRAIGSVAP